MFLLCLGNRLATISSLWIGFGEKGEGRKEERIEGGKSGGRKAESKEHRQEDGKRSYNEGLKATK